ncbi:hypothetical protein LJC07_04575 [Christensenellaceae bacterium OttesenSCG-928-L17]|nr:hypothetical protein [Christensenellaceae bacterium OttesenSCG-928-L17]
MLRTIDWPDHGDTDILFAVVWRGLPGVKSICVVSGTYRLPEGRVFLDRDYVDYYSKNAVDMLNLSRAMESVWLSLFSVNLMNCRNITLEDFNPNQYLPRQQRRARERNNRPLLQYKVLHINPYHKPSTVTAGVRTDIKKGVHSVRGHFKTFTPDKPAFGKPWGVGTFWTGPYVCGNPAYGMTWKDYYIEIEKED